jgi:hypothetical protein
MCSSSISTDYLYSKQPKKKVSANKHHHWAPFTINSVTVTEIEEQYQVATMYK